MRRPVIVISSLTLIFSGLSISSAHALADGPISCGTSGSFQITNNEVVSNNACAGSVNIPSGVTRVGVDAFSGASAITSVTIPSTVTTIGTGAFQNTSSLTSVRIPEGVITIDVRAFQGATSLTTVTIPSTVTSLGGRAFYGMSSLANVYMSGNRPSVAAWTFLGSPASASLHIKSSATGYQAIGTIWEGIKIVNRVYLANFDSNGGSSVSPAGFTEGELIASAPTAPTRSNHTFNGWSETDGGSLVTFPYTPTSINDITFFASWTADALPETVSSPAVSRPAAGINTAKSVTKSIQFSISKKVLTKPHMEKLKKSVKVSGIDATYVVTGSAGMQPGVTKAQVEKLAKLRADVVKVYLVKLGVNKSSISIKIKITNQGIVPKTKTLARYLTS